VLVDLDTARRDIAAALAEADPDRVTAAQAATLLTLFAEIERLGAAGKVLFSKRAAESTIWRDEGHRSAASWMAKTTGTDLGDAMLAVETSEALGSLPETARALRRGELSGVQVKVIAGAAVSDPRTEAGLLEAAATRGLKGLKAQALQVGSVAGSAEEEKARYLAIHRGRYLRHWADPDRALRPDARLTPDAGAKLLSA